MENLDYGLILQALGAIVAGLMVLVGGIRLIAEPMGKFRFLRKLSDWLKKLHDVLSPLTLGNQSKLSIGVHRPIPLEELEPTPYKEPEA